MLFPEDFDSRLTSVYNSAKESGSLIFTTTDTHMSQETEYDILCEIAYAPALALKPQGVVPEAESRPATPKVEKKSNPFLPHDPTLFVMDIGEEHMALLNKFCVVPRHFLVKQTDPLSPNDLLAVWGALNAVKCPGDAVAFYNCGARSGASQPHKHMQVIPLDRPAPIAALVRNLAKAQPGRKEKRPGDMFSAPFNCINHITLLQDPAATNKSQEDVLLDAYISLMDAMHTSLREYAEQEGLSEDEQRQVTSKVSYNWLLTSKFMMIVPRRQEATNPYPDAISGISININSLGFAGLVLTKRDEEMKMVKEKGGVFALVSETGFSFKQNTKKTPEEEELMNQKKKEQEQLLEKQIGGALLNLDQ
ncbi:bifunctional AP-4-A phosphorylase/ADP sulfurylase [Lobosporangium transversale]|nr:bifunctional AP-4-A phosphorylase/ADP sulfurylase [Lobosporangium transversale]